MIDEIFLRSLGILIVTAALFAFVARVVKMPAIVACLLAGLVLGPVTGLVDVTDDLAHISEAGIALLLFVVGLELSFARIRDVGKVAIVAGLRCGGRLRLLLAARVFDDGGRLSCHRAHAYCRLNFLTRRVPG